MNENEQKTETKLIAFDQSKKITFYGQCIPSINAETKCLIVTTEDSQILFTATFEQIFMQKQNFLFIIDHRTSADSALNFPSVEQSSTLLNAIKELTIMEPSNQLMEDYFFKYNFFIPIFNHIKADTNGYEELKAEIFDLLNSFAPDKREEYMTLGLQILLTGSSLQQQKLVQVDAPHASKSDQMNEPDDSGSTNQNFNDSFSMEDSMNDESSSFNNVSSTRIQSSRKRNLPNLSYADMEESEDDENSSSSSNTMELSNSVSRFANRAETNSSIVKLPGFKLYESFCYGKMRPRLFIFNSEDRTHGYRYYFNSANDIYFCRDCLSKFHIYNTAKVIKNSEGDYVKLNGRKHKCTPTEFGHDGKKKKKQEKRVPVVVDDESKIVESDDYVVYEKKRKDKLFKRLFIFDITNRTVGREYCYREAIKGFYCSICKKRYGIYVTAKIFNDSNGEFVRLRNEHQCDLQYYEPPAAENVSDSLS